MVFPISADFTHLDGNPNRVLKPIESDTLPQRDTDMIAAAGSYRADIDLNEAGIDLAAPRQLAVNDFIYSPKAAGCICHDIAGAITFESFHAAAPHLSR